MLTPAHGQPVQHPRARCAAKHIRSRILWRNKPCDQRLTVYRSFPDENKSDGRPLVGACEGDDESQLGRRSILKGIVSAAGLHAGGALAAETGVVPSTPPVTGPLPLPPKKVLSPGPPPPSVPKCPQVELQGIHALRDPSINRGLATDAGVRKKLHLSGLLPARQTTLKEEVERLRQSVALASSPLDRYRVLMAARDTQQQCFYSLLQQDLVELLPFVYTPTVADACLQWGRLLPRPHGLYVSTQDAGNVEALVANIPQTQIRSGWPSSQMAKGSWAWGTWACMAWGYR